MNSNQVLRILQFDFDCLAVTLFAVPSNFVSTTAYDIEQIAVATKVIYIISGTKKVKKNVV